MNVRSYRKLEEINGRIINATVEKETKNKYYVSVIFDKVEPVLSKITPSNNEKISFS